MIIGLTGQKRSGKDTFAQSIEREINSISFAAPMKEIAKIMFDINDIELEEQKETLKLNGVTPRTFLQQFGTELCRNLFGTSIWTQKALSKIRNSKINIITDVRFDNEAEEIKKLGGIIVKVIRGEEKPAEHASEMGIDPKYVDFLILNDGTLEDYKLKSRRLFKSIENMIDDFQNLFTLSEEMVFQATGWEFDQLIGMKVNEMRGPLEDLDIYQKLKQEIIETLEETSPSKVKLEKIQEILKGK